MKLIVAVAFLAVALAAPQGDKKPIEIVSSNSEMNADGSYSFDFESADGTKVSESGNQKQVGAKPELIHGEGEKATGNHLPTPPPMPDHGNHLPTPPPMPDHGNHLPTPPPIPDHGNHLSTPPPMPNHGNHLPTPPPMPDHGNHLPTPPPMPDHGNHLSTPPPMPDHGNHLPTPPPMPEHFVKMLADLKAARVL